MSAAELDIELQIFHLPAMGRLPRRGSALVKPGCQPVRGFRRLNGRARRRDRRLPRSVLVLIEGVLCVFGKEG
jgi:hypothetical protein